MVRRAMLLAALLAGLAILVSTGAVPLNSSTDAIGSADEIHIETNETPYAYIDEETGEAVIHIGPDSPVENVDAGVNPDTYSIFDHVLTLENNDSEPVAVWIEDAPDQVTFLGPDGKPLTESSPAQLSPDRSVRVGLQVDTRGEDVTIGEGSFTIAAEGLDKSNTGGDGTSENADGSAGGGEGGNGLAEPLVALEKGPGMVNVTVITDEQADPLIEESTLAMPTADAKITAVEPFVGPVRTVLQLDAQPLSVINTSAMSQTDPLGAVNITPIDRPNEGIDAATIQFTVAESALDNRMPELYHRTNGSWVPLETTVIERSDGTVTAEATTYGFSMFAIGADAPPISVFDFGLSDGTITAGQSVTVTATLENSGELNTSIPVPLTINGDVYDQTTVDIPANGTTTVSLGTMISEPGTHELFVNGERAGTVTVQPQTETSAAVLSDAGLLLVAAIAAIVGIGLLRRRL